MSSLVTLLQLCVAFCCVAMARPIPLLAALSIKVGLEVPNGNPQFLRPAAKSRSHSNHFQDMLKCLLISLHMLVQIRLPSTSTLLSRAVVQVLTGRQMGAQRVTWRRYQHSSVTFEGSRQLLIRKDLVQAMCKKWPVFIIYSPGMCMLAC